MSRAGKTPATGEGVAIAHTSDVGPVDSNGVSPDYFHKPSSARMWNYLQGGDDYYDLDRIAGNAFAATYPDIFVLARQCRRFLARAVRYVAAEGGVRQFLDLGCGMPAAAGLGNTHEIAQSVHPDARVVYVDNDRVVVLAHARAWLTSSSPEGVCAYLEADVHDIEHVLSEAAQVLDFDRPVAAMFCGILGAIADFDEARSIVGRVLDTVVPGSHVLVDDGVDDGGAARKGVEHRNRTGMNRYHLRTGSQFARYFEGTELVAPGIGPPALWRPDSGGAGVQPAGSGCCAVARKP